MNCIAPGFHGEIRLGSVIWAKGGEERRKNFEGALTKAIPIGRRGNVVELKGLLLYLASSASIYVTGQVFISDDGICI